jgi:AraC-like DNA-binding protein
VDRPRLLWVDLTVSVKHAELPVVFTESCDIKICSDASRVEEAIESNSIDCVCIDMDYPDHGSLNLLRTTKMSYPRLPILLLTLQHSESLAVWAFRSRVLDFLVKPVSRGEFHRCLQNLRYVTNVAATQRSRNQGDNIAPIPPEIPLTMRTDDVRLLPALYYVKQNFRFKIRNEVVSELCEMSPFRFSRSFRETYGITFQDYVIRYRILESCRLLKNPSSNITDVAYAIGFNDASYFSRTFRRYVGTSPSNYSSEYRDEPDNSEDSAYLRALLNMPDDRSASGGTS